MNKIILIGNLTKDPENATTQNGVNYTRFNLAVNRRIPNAAGERTADYFDIIAWRQLADSCFKYLHKGSKVGITGAVQRRQYTDKNGVARTSFDVVADEVEFLSSKTNGQNQALNSRGGAKCAECEDVPTDAVSCQGDDKEPLTGDMQEVSNDFLSF